MWRQNWRFLQGTGIFRIPDAAGTFSDLIGWNGRIHCGSLAKKKENENITEIPKNTYYSNTKVLERKWRQSKLNII